MTNDLQTYAEMISKRLGKEREHGLQDMDLPEEERELTRCLAGEYAQRIVYQDGFKDQGMETPVEEKEDMKEEKEQEYFKEIHKSIGGLVFVVDS